MPLTVLTLLGAEAQRPSSWRWAHPAEHDALRSAVEAATAGQLPPGLSGAGWFTFCVDTLSRSAAKAGLQDPIKQLGDQ